VNITVTPDLGQLARIIAALRPPRGTFKAAAVSGLTRSVFWARGEIKRAIARNALGWPETQKYKGLFSIERAINARKNKEQPKRLFGKLANAIMYDINKTALIGRVGIIPGYRGVSNTAGNIATLFQAGGPRPLDQSIGKTGRPKFQGLFAWAGAYLKRKTTTLNIPRRPLFAPMGERISGEMTERFYTGFSQKIVKTIFQGAYK
jgi:hypothetical protein